MGRGRDPIAGMWLDTIYIYRFQRFSAWKDMGFRISFLPPGIQMDHVIRLGTVQCPLAPSIFKYKIQNTYI